MLSLIHEPHTAYHVREIKYTRAAFVKAVHQSLKIETLWDIMPTILIKLPHSAHSSIFTY